MVKERILTFKKTWENNLLMLLLLLIIFVIRGSELQKCKSGFKEIKEIVNNVVMVTFWKERNMINTKNKLFLLM